jgi:hypothetical protein
MEIHTRHIQILFNCRNKINATPSKTIKHAKMIGFRSAHILPLSSESLMHALMRRLIEHEPEMVSESTGMAR